MLFGTCLLTGCNSNDNVVAKTGESTTQQSNTAQSASDSISGTAATCDDGYEISEQSVADFILQYRTYNGLETVTKWATFLDEAGKTVSDFRQDAINNLALNHAIEIEAKDKGVSVSDEEINEQINLAKTSAKASNDETWKSVIEIAGYKDENAYRDDIKTHLLKDKLSEDNNGGEITPSDSDMLAQATSNKDKYTGKKLIEIVFMGNSETAANNTAKVIGKTSDASSFKQAGVKAIDSGTAESVTDSGWTCLMNDNGGAVDATKDLRVGDVTTYTATDGTIRIALVTESYEETNKSEIILSDMPDEIKSKLRNDTVKEMKANRRANYLQGLLDNLNVKINDMPSGLPYDVDLENSEYGTQTTTEQDTQEAQNLVNEHLENLAKAGNNNYEE